jgi:hypothetical protein
MRRFLKEDKVFAIKKLHDTKLNSDENSKEYNYKYPEIRVLLLKMLKDMDLMQEY